MKNGHSLRMTAEQYQAIANKGKPSKYKNKKKLINGIEFDSTKEATRYQDLAAMQACGRISDLRRQVPYPIYINGIFVCDYRADFVYVCDKIRIVEDVKGHRTDIYKLKKKMVEAEYKIKIKET